MLSGLFKEVPLYIKCALSPSLPPSLSLSLTHTHMHTHTHTLSLSLSQVILKTHSLAICDNPIKMIFHAGFIGQSGDSMDTSSHTQLRKLLLSILLKHNESEC